MTRNDKECAAGEAVELEEGRRMEVGGRDEEDYRLSDRSCLSEQLQVTSAEEKEGNRGNKQSGEEWII